MNKRMKQIYLFIALWLASMVSVYAQYQLNVYGQEIMDTYQLTTIQFSALFTAPMLPAIFLSFLTGKLSDTVGSRKIVGGYLVITVVGLIGRLAVNDYTGMMAAMMLTGFGAIAVTVNAAKILGSVFPINKLSLAMGIYTTGSMLAQTMATATSSILFEDIGGAFVAAAVLGGIITVIWWAGMLLIPEKREEKQETNQSSFLEIIKNSGVWITGLCLFITLGVTVTLNTFLPVALIATGKYTQTQAGTISAMVSLGNLFGAILGPVLHQKIKSLRAFLTIVSIAAAAGSAFAWKVENVPLLLVAMTCTGMFLGSAMPVYFSTPMSLQGISEHNLATASGLTTTMQLTGAVVVPTYILAPIADGNYRLMFLLAGALMLSIPILSVMLSHKIKQEGE